MLREPNIWLRFLDRLQRCSVWPQVRTARIRTVARKSSVGNFTIVQGGLTLKIWQKFH